MNDDLFKKVWTSFPQGGAALTLILTLGEHATEDGVCTVPLSQLATAARMTRSSAVPERSTLKGKRDYVILALLTGCALRRKELATLDVGTIQSREGRWVLADLCGKGRRIRTVAVPV